MRGVFGLIGKHLVAISSLAALMHWKH